jgi:two-component system chemotaxis response regulator CheY
MTDYILCVDDEQAVLNQLSALLGRRLGEEYRIECAESADEALSLIAELHDGGDQVQLVICDQVMPGTKGDRLLETIHTRWPEIMKILLTGEAGLDSAIYAINHAGLHRYIEKPWHPEDLLLAVQNLLTQYRLRRDMTAYHARLERRSEELHGLHEVALQLASAEDPDQVLSLVRQEARRLVAGCEVVAERGARLVLSGCRSIAVSHGDTMYGWLLAPEASDPASDDLLAILAHQAAARLHSFELLAARVEHERLSAIGRMLSSIIHDFRNPMTLIKGYGSMVGDPGLVTERRAQYAALIVEEADRMSAMIEELLDYSRGRRTPLHRAHIPVPDLVEHLRRWIAGELDERGITLATQLEYAGPVLVDIDRMKRALLNIASNAMESMDKGGTLTFASRSKDGAVELTLTDTGRGIPPELQEKVFEPFFSHGKRSGLGLGMTITRKIVEEHGGEVRLHSVPGQGTRLTLRFPDNPAPSESPAPFS